MKWYNVHFDATRSDPQTYVRKVRIEQRVMAVSPVEAIRETVAATFGDYGYIEASFLDGDVWIPCEWDFVDPESPYGDLSFKFWIDEESAVLADMVFELSPAEELRMMGMPTLFDEETA